jgi:hypothetical protein
MKALTIWQPWASLIMAGCKPYEFPGWPPPRWVVGQRIVIQAATRLIKNGEMVDLLNRLGTSLDGTGLIAGPALDLLQRAWHRRAILLLAAGLSTAVLGKPAR